MPRRHLDQYFTPEWATRVLLYKHTGISGILLECCSGDGAIANPLRSRGTVQTNDIDIALPADEHGDATDPWFWRNRSVDWVVSNPPFNCCQPIIEGAFAAARKGVAMLLRLSYLEPCNNRADFLSNNPPTNILVLPRISFTGDGKTDNVTCAWFVWDFESPDNMARPIEVVSKAQASRIMGSETAQ